MKRLLFFSTCILSLSLMSSQVLGQIQLVRIGQTNGGGQAFSPSYQLRESAIGVTVEGKLITSPNYQIGGFYVKSLPWPLDRERSKVEVVKIRDFIADGVDSAEIRVTLLDLSGDAIPNREVIIDVSGEKNIVDPTRVDTNSLGQATFIMRSTKSEQKRASVIIDGIPLFTQTVEFKPGPPEKIDIKVSQSKLLADGKSQTGITITVSDKGDNPIKDAKVELSANIGTVPKVADPKGDGSYVATYTSGTKSDMDTIKATVGSKSNAAQVELIPSIDREGSEVEATPNEVIADGVAAATIKVTLKDLSGNVIPNKEVAIKVSGEKNTIKPDKATTNPSGEASFTLKSTKDERKDIEIIVDSIPLIRKPSIVFKPTIEPSIIFLPIDARIDDEITISGSIILPPKGVQIQDELPIRLIAIPPSQPAIPFALRTDKNLAFSAKVKVNETKEWQVEASWEGNKDYAPTKGTGKFTVKKRISEIEWSKDLPQKVRFGDPIPITIQGQLKKPLLKDQTISLNIINPNSVLSAKNLTTNEVSSFEHAFVPDLPGIWRFIAKWNGNEDSEPGESKELKISVNPEWKAIIIQGGGDKNSNPDWMKFHKLTNDVYKIFKKRHFSDDDIYYLNPSSDKSLARDAITSETGLKSAITDWAARNVNPKVPLFIYMLSHNLEASFLLEKQPGKAEVFLSASKLDEWLDALPQGTQVIIIIEACYSGNFITQKEFGKPVLSNKDRIIITSSGSDTQSWIYNNSSFTRLFFDEIHKNKTIAEAFSNVEDILKSNNLYRLQQPQIDANGNGIPNEQDDRTTAKNRFFPIDATSLGKPPVFDPLELGLLQKPKQLKAGETKATISVKISGAGRIEVTGVITPPSFSSSKVFKSWDELKFDEIKFESKEGGIYEATYDKFAEPGTYSIVITAESEDGSSIPVEARVEAPPAPSWDVNKDREVNIFDLVIVAGSFGQEILSPPPVPNPDINGDGKVDILDLVLVATHFGEKTGARAAPRRDFEYSELLSNVSLMRQLLQLLEAIPNPNAAVLKAISELRRLIAMSEMPSVTKLLPSYPNPFNPETWIPYQLKESNKVTITIYDISGRLIRQLNLGHKHAGFYLTKDKAAYWDGRNLYGERVASGIYFYTFQASRFIANRKLLMIK